MEVGAVGGVGGDGPAGRHAVALSERGEQGGVVTAEGVFHSADATRLPLGPQPGLLHLASAAARARVQVAARVRWPHGSGRAADRFRGGEDPVQVVVEDGDGRFRVAPADEDAGAHRRGHGRQADRLRAGVGAGIGALGLDRVHLVGSSYGGWLVLNQAHRRPGRIASVTALDPGGLERVGLRFFAWVFVSLFASFAPKALRPRLAAWLEQPVLVVPELRTFVQTGARAFRIRRPAPLPLAEDALGSIRSPLYLIMGKRSLLVHPQRQLERVPRLIPGARAEIIAATGHGPQIDHPDVVNARMLGFMEDVDSRDPHPGRVDG
ncbi:MULTISPECIES: alpha/beta fold hydrolase [unclassified Streptomyces]|uniref:alpha/beta fold hydrolase n=1 Tax=unclassified Streptomyces TaxID=2593676 RepID=UPI0036467DD5